jgi:hypothetical protein
VIRRAISDTHFVRNINRADKAVEVSDTVKEPAVTKSAHIAGEVVSRKDGTGHVTSKTVSRPTGISSRHSQ